LKIDVSGLALPPHWLLSVEGLLEIMSGVDEIHFKGAKTLPLRLLGVLREARSGKQPLVEEDHRITKKVEGHWELVAPKYYCKVKDCKEPQVIWSRLDQLRIHLIGKHGLQEAEIDTVDKVISRRFGAYV
jgi:hypothetical protein